jgi:hypothetical protein
MTHYSSQHHSFDIALASKYGEEEAILIHHFKHWIRLNRFKKKNIRDGKCWTYQSRKDIAAYLPYWSVDEVRRLTEKLERQGVLISANFNKSPIDKTLWYAFVDELAFGVDEESSNNFYERQKCQSSGKSAKPIPDTKTKDTKEGESEDSLKRERAPRALTRERAPHGHTTDQEHKKLENDFGVEATKEMYQILSEWKLDKPKKAGEKMIIDLFIVG